VIISRVAHVEAGAADGLLDTIAAASTLKFPLGLALIVEATHTRGLVRANKVLAAEIVARIAVFATGAQLGEQLILLAQLEEADAEVSIALVW
jgi:hypothetical protein